MGKIPIVGYALLQPDSYRMYDTYTQVVEAQSRCFGGYIIHLYNGFSVDEEITKLKIALADAVRSPMGVIPTSAEGLISFEDLEEAEKRR
jgi:hypothetical protein